MMSGPDCITRESATGEKDKTEGTGVLIGVVVARGVLDGVKVAVAVGGTGVLVKVFVAVGGRGVLVAVGGIGVLEGVNVDVAVGGIGVFVEVGGIGVLVGVKVDVAVGGTGV